MQWYCEQQQFFRLLKVDPDLMLHLHQSRYWDCYKIWSRRTWLHALNSCNVSPDPMP